MSPIVLAIILGLTAALANVAGGTILVQRAWPKRYLMYFMAVGAGFMLATSIMEMIPTSVQLDGERAGLLVLLGYLLIHFFEHELAHQFQFGEEAHEEE